MAKLRTVARRQAAAGTECGARIAGRPGCVARSATRGAWPVRVQPAAHPPRASAPTGRPGARDSPAGGCCWTLCLSLRARARFKCERWPQRQRASWFGLPGGCGARGGVGGCIALPPFLAAAVSLKTSSSVHSSSNSSIQRMAAALERGAKRQPPAASATSFVCVHSHPQQSPQQRFLVQNSHITSQRHSRFRTNMSKTWPQAPAIA